MPGALVPRHGRAQGVNGMLVDQFALASQAAMSGLGVALLPRFLIEPNWRAAIWCWPSTRAGGKAPKCYLAWRPSGSPALQAFRAWLAAAARKPEADGRSGVRGIAA